jgi:hypothetical protein
MKKTRQHDTLPLFHKRPVPARSVFFFLIPVFILLSSVRTVAQLQRNTIPRTATSSPANASARTKAAPKNPLSLPFWDDFSFTLVDDPYNPLSNVPIDSIWTSGSKDVWINEGIGVHAPSYNVATFDGLNGAGAAYSNISTANGLRDSLTSQRIDLSETGVAVSERNSVFLSFYYQWQGNGEPPDATDFLRLQFKDNTGAWETVMTIVPSASLSRTEFYDTTLQVLRTANDSKFFHKGFQFRLENFGRKAGPFDTWNVDYIYLNKNRSLNNNSVPDRALASGTSQLFGDYRAAVLDHFMEQKTLRPVEFDVKSNKSLNTENATTYSTTYIFNHLKKDSSRTQSTFLNTPVTAVPSQDGGGILRALERTRVKDDCKVDLNDPQYFDANNLRIDLTYKIQLQSNDQTDADRGLFAPLDFRINDSLKTTFSLANYYAYDDGTAEYSAALQGALDKAAYRFELLHDNPDTLIGLDVYIPDFAISSANNQMTFYVYNDNNDHPDAEPIFAIPYTIKTQGGMNRFQRVSIIDDIVRVSKRFYIAWSGKGIPIGLDVSNNTASYMFQNIDLKTWTEADVSSGSLMIRPIFGKGLTGPPLGIPEEAATFLYPNPNHGEFYIDQQAKVEEVLNAMGQSVPFSTQSVDAGQRITLQTSSPGLYLIKTRKHQKVSVQKIIVH